MTFRDTSAALSLRGLSKAFGSTLAVDRLDGQPSLAVRDGAARLLRTPLPIDRNLGEVGPDAAPAVPALLQMQSRGTPNEQQIAAQSLAKIGAPVP